MQKKFLLISTVIIGVCSLVGDVQSSGKHPKNYTVIDRGGNVVIVRPKQQTATTLYLDSRPDKIIPIPPPPTTHLGEVKAPTILEWN